MSLEIAVQVNNHAESISMISKTQHRIKWKYHSYIFYSFILTKKIKFLSNLGIQKNNYNKSTFQLMYKKHKPTKIQRFSDVERLQQRIKTETPVVGDYFYDYKLDEAKKQQSLMNKDEFHLKYKINFADLPISSLTLKGLNNKNFIKMTQVQRCVIPHALGGRDIMAASRTGSGKTLSYLIPLIQKLYRNKFMPMDGLGAIVLVPVRQLAMQVFEVLNSFTSHMQISIGLIIGGKDIKYEKEKIGLMNVLVCTPGRLLQHLEQTYGFETNNLQMLVIDEADVMLEMGFRNTLKSILENIPKCQTLFFSATLNNEIHKLSQQCMTNPERIFLHTIKHTEITSNKDEKKNIDTIYQTPAKLMQYYMVVSPQDKLNVLYSFLKTHNKQKVLIFASTCKQVRFIYEAFRKFRLSSPLYELQGHQNQKKRMAIYFTFCQKKYGILVCTNIASRGLDFPMVDWVIQLDIPEDVETYVHRVGRTARFKYDGKSLAFVSEHELEFVNNLKSKNIKIHKITQNPEKYFRIDSSLQSICSEHQDVKYLAQRALISYIQFVYKSGNKAIFNLKHLDLELLAKSFGLQNAPNLSIVQESKQKQDDEEQDEGKKLTKIQKLRMKAKLAKQKKRQQKEGQHKVNEENEEQESQQSEQQEQSPQQLQQDNQQQFLKVTKKIKLDENSKPILTVSKNQLKKIKPQGHFEGKNKIIFDQNLKPITVDQHRVKRLLQSNETNTKINRNFEFQIQNRLEVNREIDEKNEKERRKIRRKKIEIQKQEAKRGHSMSGPQEAVLGDSDDEQ